MFNNGIFDTHCHLMTGHYEEQDVTILLNEASVSGGIGTILNVGYDLNSSKKAVIQTYQAANETETIIPKIYAAVGIHPTEVNNCDENTIQNLTYLVKTGCVIGIGEIGLDYFHNFTTREQQKEWFIKQLKLAKKFDLPVLLHIRDAFEDAYKIVKEQGITKGVLHCFTGNLAIAKKFLDLGFYVSFSGNITYKNAKNLQEVVKEIPNNRILVETDAPYLTPEPLRGKKPNKDGLTVNVPINIVFTVRKIAELKGIPVKTVVNMTSDNAKKVFNL